MMVHQKGQICLYALPDHVLVPSPKNTVETNRRYFGVFEKSGVCEGQGNGLQIEAHWNYVKKAFVV